MNQELKQLREELHMLNADYAIARAYRDTASSNSIKAYYIRRMEWMDKRMALLADRIGALVSNYNGVVGVE